MKSIILSEAGDANNLSLAELSIPEYGHDEVLVKVKALSINPVDIKTRNGKALYGQLKDEQPLILGWDISGEVVSSGKDVVGIEVGDEVFGMVNFPGHGKAYAEFVAVPYKHLAKKPANIINEEAAAATLAALTAWQVLKDQLQVKAGERILIHAGAGGVGHFAIQIAKHMGAYVVTTASASNAEFVKELGADEHIDYTAVSFESTVSDIDAVFDTVGGDISRRSLGTLREGGRVLSIAGGVNDEVKNLAEEQGISTSTYLVQSSGDDMKSLAELLEKGILKAHVSAAYQYTEIADAHRQIESGKTKGKIVVKFD